MLTTSGFGAGGKKLFDSQMSSGIKISSTLHLPEDEDENEE
jgi:hypothetical protein